MNCPRVQVAPLKQWYGINEIESAPDLETSCTMKRGKVADETWRFLILRLRGSQENHQRRLHKKGLHSRGSCTKKKTLTHGTASRMDDLRVFSRSATQTNLFLDLNEIWKVELMAVPHAIAMKNQPDEEILKNIFYTYIYTQYRQL